MNNPTIEYQAKMYVYDLKNCASEFGFKADEYWEVGMASREEKSAIEKQYAPTLSASVLPEMLCEMLRVVRYKLTQQLVGSGKPIDLATIRQQHLQYLVAYSPNRVRR
ncbi:hypothetical protein [Mucilaginibacter aquaedulcis]|uniref:hypothetical protein n=1 Tax=Mucilaginibacter aquaedulcis TaxID=1187081 RepID=UPI0025B5D9E6|nr:hypothetical protein [Mucilaginibacter aquaedulcis]MDN3551619.1 hypothetical protein [Mucilaginibacter aquaedulcis]